ncbi:membrane protein [Mycobacterium phage Collard]|uniref:Membrane protein n=1 Tax=Mycobacterium phage Collard TaxID=2301704 RepID=A0A385DWZ5_9CAUD|nr:membrane protein [Mycobacterium phage Collard]AXQ63247.1 membrane protein [Mycobacterium phage Collard]
MGKHNAKRTSVTTGIVGGLLAFGAIITAAPAAADVDDTNTAAPAADTPAPAPAKHDVGKDVQHAVRTVLELNRERPLQKYPAPLVRAAQVWGDSVFHTYNGPDGEPLQYSVKLSQSQLAQEYRKAFGAAASDPDVVAVCGNTNGCDGYIKGVLNTPLPHLSQADRLNTAGYAQRTGSCKGLPTGALQRCQSAGK